MYILNFYIAIKVSSYEFTYAMLVNYYSPAETNAGPLVTLYYVLRISYKYFPNEKK